MGHHLLYPPSYISNQNKNDKLNKKSKITFNPRKFEVFTGCTYLNCRNNRIELNHEPIPNFDPKLKPNRPKTELYQFPFLNSQTRPPPPSHFPFLSLRRPSALFSRHNGDTTEGDQRRPIPPKRRPATANPTDSDTTEGMSSSSVLFLHRSSLPRMEKTCV